MSDNPFIPEIIEEIEGLSQAQMLRMQLENQVYVDLMKFLQSNTQIILAKNDLEEELERKLTERLTNEERPLSDSNLIRLFEVIKKDKSERSTGILQVLQKSTNITINSDNPTNQGNKDNKPSENLDISKEELQMAKELLSLIKRIEKTEFTPQETPSETQE